MVLPSLLLAISIALGVCATPHNPAHRHNGIAKRHSAEIQLHKRFSDARWSFYDVGLGACGLVNVQSDYIVALNADQFGSGYPGPHCFETITMSYNGKTAQATIMDRCPGCPYGGLDLSRGLFTHFASEDAGIIYGTWTFNDGSGGGGGAQPSPSPSPSPSPKPKTTSHSTTSTTPWSSPTPEPTTTSSSSSRSSSTSTSSTTTTTSSTTSSTTTSTSSTSVDYTSNGLAVPTGTLPSTPGSVENLNGISLLLIQCGGLIVAASSLQ